MKHDGTAGAVTSVRSLTQSRADMRARTASRATSTLEPVSGLEYPRDDQQKHRQKQRGHAEAHLDVHIGESIEAPAKSANQINDRIEQRHRPPERRQHIHRIEASAEKRERRDDQERHELQLLEAIRPYADDETEQTERDCSEHQKQDDPEWVQ